MDEFNYILVSRFGGAGDLLMAEPTIEALYYKFAPARIILRTYCDYEWVLSDHPLIWKTILDDFKCRTYGFLESGIIQTDLNGTLPAPERITHINLSDAVEVLNGIHGIEAFSGMANAKPLRKTPSFGHYDFPLNHKIVVQLRSMKDTRDLLKSDLPMHLLEDATFIEGEMDPKEFRNLIAGADMFIGPDSSGLHIAHAAGVRKIVGLYAPGFPYGLRAYPGIQVATNTEELAWKIQAALEEPKYPEWVHTGDAIGFIKGEALTHCRGRGLDVGANAWPFPGAVAIETEYQRDKFNEGPFDFIVSSHCLEHISEWQAELKLWAESVRVGGTVFIYLPHPRMELWLPGSPWVGEYHVWSPEPNSLVKWLNENTSLQVDEYSCYPDSMWSFYIVARRTK
ncbi:MAG: methyltransferase domain-containing protein [Spirochaetota bacterium]